jgi:MFS family permease
MDTITNTARTKKANPLKFVLMIGMLSFVADFTYEGSRSILGPYLALLSAGATAVGIVTGFGELAGYGLRLVSGRMADATGMFWPITIFGYVVQMFAVPALALAGNWPTAAALIILERIGKAIRNPPRDVMLSHAAKEIGYGWAFGVHESLDQFGALFGPLAVAAILALRGDYRLAFAALLLPGMICLALLLVARWLYPRPQEMEVETPNLQAKGLPRVFWIYLAGAALVAAGFADFPLIAFHFQKTSSVSQTWVPIAYAIAMAVSGTGSLAFGRFFDRFGIGMLIPLTLVTALFAPLVFFGSFWVALVARRCGGLGWGFMNQSSQLPLLQWFDHSAALRLTDSSPRDTACFGFWVALSSASYTTDRSRPLWPFASRASSRLFRFFSWLGENIEQSKIANDLRACAGRWSSSFKLRCC